MEMAKDAQDQTQARLVLDRIYVKSSTFESFGVTLETFQKPLQPVIEVKCLANSYAQENNSYHLVLGLSIEAKHQAEVLWKLHLEQAAFYTLEGFKEAQQGNILNGFCMNQLYAYAIPVVTQMVTQGGFVPLYLQPMDFHQLYQARKQEKPVEPAPRLNPVKKEQTPLAFSESVLN